MKNFSLVFTFVLFLLSGAIYAQEITPVTQASTLSGKNEITGGFAYTNSGGLSGVLEYRHYFKKNMGLSVGLLSNEDTENKYHIGLENYIPIGNQLSFYTGLRLYYVKRGFGGIDISDFTNRKIEYGIPLAIRYDINDKFSVRFEGEILNDRLSLLSGDGSTGMHLKFGYKF